MLSKSVSVGAKGRIIVIMTQSVETNLMMAKVYEFAT